MAILFTSWLARYRNPSLFERDFHCSPERHLFKCNFGSKGRARAVFNPRRNFFRNSSQGTGANRRLFILISKDPQPADIRRQLEDSLRAALITAEAEYQKAKAEFADKASLCAQLGPAHTDGALALRKACKLERVALQKYCKAHKAFNDHSRRITRRVEAPCRSCVAGRRNEMNPPAAG